MSLITTPGQLAKRAEFYQQLAQLTSAGIGVVGALNQIQRSPPAASYRAPLEKILGELARGHTLVAALASTDDWLPDFDRALLHAGEQSGRLDQCFRLLSDYYASRARLARQMLSQLLYPVGLLHFAVFVFKIILPFAAGGMNFDATLLWLFVKAALWLAPFYLGAIGLLYAMQSKHGERWRAAVENILHPIPVLGTARQYLALARLAVALEALISAGVNVIPAWTSAAAASGSPDLKRVVASWQPFLAVGQTPAQLVRETSRFPEMFSNLYTTGEVSGKLDESLKQLHNYYQEEGARKLQNLAALAPKVLYIGIMLVIAYQIIKFYTGYFAQIQQAGGF